MNRKVITIIMLCFSIISSSCNTAKDVIGNDKSNTSATDSNRNFLEIKDKLIPRQYEGSNDSSIVAIITGESIDTIPKWCFSRIPSIKEVRILGKNVVVDSNAFYACKKLQKAYLDNVIKCGESTFKMTSIDAVSMKRCQFVDDFAFANCNSLYYASFSDSLKFIGDYAFFADTLLKTINLPNGDIGKCCFMECSNLKNVKLKKTRIIGEAAFLNCISLEELTIPESVEEIKDEAFSGCVNLKIVRVLNHNTKISENAFDDKNVIKYLK